MWPGKRCRSRRKNLQLPVWVLKILCLLVVRYCGVRFLCGKYRDYDAGMLHMPGLVVVYVIEHSLCRGYECLSTFICGD